MARVTKIQLKNECGNWHTYYHYRGWYCMVNGSQVWHASYNLKTGANFDRMVENEHFALGNGTIDTPEKMRKECDEYMDYLKSAYGSAKRAYREYGNC